MANIANANEEYSTKQLRRVLGKKELISMGIGQIIGSGVFSLTGVAIGYTGRSVILAFYLERCFRWQLQFPAFLQEVQSACGVGSVYHGKYSSWGEVSGFISLFT